MLPNLTKEAVVNRVAEHAFKPSSLRLTDGSLLPVPHQDFITLTPDGRTAIMLGQGQDFSIVALGLVQVIEMRVPKA